MKRFTTALGMPLLLLFLAGGCDWGSEDLRTTISGTIHYHESIALPATAVVEVSLVDVSRADAPAVVLAQQKIEGAERLPVDFLLTFDPAGIDELMIYALQVRISEGGQLLYANDTHVPVLTRGAGGHADIAVIRVSDPLEDILRDETLAGIELEGMFRYKADAGLFRDCRTGKVFPVSMEAQFAELERAYLNSAIMPGHELMVRLRGRYLERPAMEGDGNEVKLIVNHVKEVLPNEYCQSSEHASLTDTYWKLIELYGEAVTTPEGARDAHLVLSSASAQGEAQARGFGGCNSFLGGYRRTGESISFSALGSTKVACTGLMETERTFLQALGLANRGIISGLFLELYEDDRLLARFEAVYL